MSRGKPSTDQLDMTMPMMDIFNSHCDMKDDQGVDTRNYGCLEGIYSARKLLGDMLGVDLVIPDFSYVERNKERIKGLVITHGMRIISARSLTF